MQYRDTRILKGFSLYSRGSSIRVLSGIVLSMFSLHSRGSSMIQNPTDVMCAFSLHSRGYSVIKIALYRICGIFPCYGSYSNDGISLNSAA